MKLVPLANRVVLKQLDAEEKTKSGIILSSAAQEKPLEAEVVAVGPGTEEDKMILEVGDKVFYQQYAGTQIKFEGEEYIIIKQTEVLAVIKD